MEQRSPVLDRPGTETLDRIYVGRRLAPRHPGQRGDTTLVVVEHGQPERHLEVRPGGPSPSGFEWGYAGSGPAETARTILWEHLGHEPERPLYQAFKFAFIADAPIEGFAIHAVEVDAWLAVAETAREASR